MIYLTSDQHFGHTNILQYCKNRQYDTVTQMNKAMIANWNAIVSDTDEVFVVGDFTLDKNPEKTDILRENLETLEEIIKDSEGPKVNRLVYTK